MGTDSQKGIFVDMKSKEEVINGFLRRNCAVCMSEQIYRNWRQEIMGVYESGFKAGKAAEASKSVANLCDVERSISETYQNGYDNGVSDAWETAKEVRAMDFSEWEECFKTKDEPFELDGKQAIDMLIAWKDRKMEPEVTRKEREEILQMCRKEKCVECKLKHFFPRCGTGWFIGEDGSPEEVNASFMILIANERIKKCAEK